MVQELTTSNDFNEFIDGDKPAVVFFYAVWNGNCRMIARLIEKAAQKYDGKIVFGKVNIDLASDIAFPQKVETIPLVLIFQDGEELERIEGVFRSVELENEIDSLIG